MQENGTTTSNVYTLQLLTSLYISHLKLLDQILEVDFSMI